MGEPYVVHEGSLSLRGHILFCPAWRRKYVMVRADTRQLAIYNKKVSASSSGKRAECLLVQLKQVVECKADEAAGSSSKNNNRFLLQKSANAGAGHKIIFRCRDPDDRERWINVINDVMNGRITSSTAFDEIVVSSSALRHYGKTRPKNPGRRLPGRVRGQTTSANTDINSVGDDADSGVGASSELLATHATLHKSDDIEGADEIIQETPASKESVHPTVSPTKEKPPGSPVRVLPPGSPVRVLPPGRSDKVPSAGSPVKEKPTPPDVSKKPGKLSSLPRLKKQKKSFDGPEDESKAGRGKKSSSFLSRLGARLSRSLSSGGNPSPEGEVEKQEDDGGEEATATSKHPPLAEESAHSDDAKPSEEVETIGIKNEVRSARDTNYALAGDTKTKHDKVIQELSSIALNAKLVQQKAEALKLARLNSEDETSGEESTSSASAAGSRTLSRRDSEKNIEQAAQNLRSTLENLSEAELLELQKNDLEKENRIVSDRELASEDEVAEIGKMDLDGTTVGVANDSKGDLEPSPKENGNDETVTDTVIENNKDAAEEDPKSGENVQKERGQSGTENGDVGEEVSKDERDETDKEEVVETNKNCVASCTAEKGNGKSEIEQSRVANESVTDAK